MIIFILFLLLDSSLSKPQGPLLSKTPENSIEPVDDWTWGALGDGFVYVSPRQLGGVPEPEPESEPEGESEPESKASKEMPSLVDIVSTDPMFTMFTAAFGIAFPEGLPAGAPFTIFVPTEEAFAKLPAEAVEKLIADPAALKAIMLRHIIVGMTVTAKDIIAAGMVEVENAAGERLAVSYDKSKGVMVESSAGIARVVEADKMASDGIIHAIDSVI